MHTLIRFVATILVLLVAQSGFAHAGCYYPDGSVSEKDAPCGNAADGVACCPLGWSCVSNGLCWLDAESYYGRYTCSDRTWASDGCPSFCLGGVPNGTDTGNVALEECPFVASQTYCCNGDRSGNCCDDGHPTFFGLGEWVGQMTITALDQPQITASSTKPTSRSTSSETSTTVDGGVASTKPPPHTVQLGSPSLSSSENAATTIITSVASNPSNGAVSTIYLTTTADPSAHGDSSTSARSNTGTIVGCAVGVPICMALLGLLAFFLLRRHRRRHTMIKNSFPLPLPTISEEDEKASRVTELDGFPRATGGSILPSPSIAWTHNSRGSGANDFYGGGSKNNRYSHAPSEADGKPIPKHPAELETPPPIPLELEATEAGAHFAGVLHGPAAARFRASPDPKDYAVGGKTPGGLHVVNAVEGELDSEVESSPPSARNRSWRIGSWGRGTSASASGGGGGSAGGAVGTQSTDWAPSPSSMTAAESSGTGGGAVAGDKSPVSPLPDGTWQHHKK